MAKVWPAEAEGDQRDLLDSSEESTKRSSVERIGASGEFPRRTHGVGRW